MMITSKFIKHLLLVGIMLFSVGSTALASDWKTLSARGSELESTDPEWPVQLTIKPSAASSCSVTGMYLGRYMCSLKGEAWPDGNSIRIKVKGDISSNAKLMIYGTLTYHGASTVEVEGDLSVDINGSGTETACSFYMKDKRAEAEAARLEAERYKSSPEYRVKTILEGFIHSGRISPKKDKNIGRALGAYASSGIDGALSSANANKTLDISKGQSDGEIEICDLAQDHFQYTLTDGSTASFAIATRSSFTTDNIAVSAYASSDMDSILFVCGSFKNRKAFLAAGNRLYTIKKSAQKSLLSHL